SARGADRRVGRRRRGDVPPRAPRCERVRDPRRRGLSHVLELRARTRRAVGHVPMARPRAAGPQRARRVAAPPRQVRRAMSPMGSMPMMPPAMAALGTVAMMVAMMLPSIAPTLWRYHRQLRETAIPLAAWRTANVAAGYAAVWTAIALALFAVSTALPRAGFAPPANSPLARLASGAIILSAG